MLAAIRVAVQPAPLGRAAAGVKVRVLVPDPLGVTAMGPPQSSVNPPMPKLTGSLNTALNVALLATIAPAAGVELTNAGAASTVKVAVKSAAGLFGGSMRSTSLTLAAGTNKVQLPEGSGAA